MSRSRNESVAIHRREFVPRDHKLGGIRTTQAVYATMAVVGIRYYSRRERQGTSETSVPGVRSRRQQDGRRAAIVHVAVS